MTAAGDGAGDGAASRPAAAALFGDRLALADRYAQALCTTGMERGLLGPRETDRLWQRHLLQGAVLAPLVPAGTTVLDIGSGAGLPGLPLALARPDVQVVLLDAALRRTTFLQQVVDLLGLAGQVSVLRGRLEELPAAVHYPVLTARAVAALPTLRRWAGPHVSPGGRLLALVGAQAAAELAGQPGVTLHLCGVELLAEPVTVAEVAPV